MVASAERDWGDLDVERDLAAPLLARHTGEIDPLDLARAFVRRPGMFTSAERFEQVVVWLRGYDDALAAVAGVTTTDGMQQRPTSRYSALLRAPSTGPRNEEEDRVLIRCLEPLAAELFAEARRLSQP